MASIKEFVMETVCLLGGLVAGALVWRQSWRGGGKDFWATVTLFVVAGVLYNFFIGQFEIMGGIVNKVTDELRDELRQTREALEKLKREIRAS